MDKILRVNSREGNIDIQPCSREETRWGGRSLIANLLLREAPPTCNPLGRFNKFIVASGLLADTNLATAGRCSVGGKSPLTHGVKESNLGGMAGRKMARMGYRAVILEDAPSKFEPRVLHIKHGGAGLLLIPELKALEVSPTFDLLQERFGEHCGLLCIGPAGELRLAGASVASRDQSALQTRFAGRGGLGAVMGAKGIKAIVFDDEGAPKPPAFDRAALRQVGKEFAKILLADPKTPNRHNFGTPAVLDLCNELGILPTRNFSSGVFKDAAKIDGAAVKSLIDERGGEAGRGLPCVQGCIIRCSNVFADPGGKKSVASIQYENIGLLGSNLDIGDIDQIAELNDLVNEMGLDTIETGAALGVAMEAGVLAFGDAQGAKDAIRQAGQGTVLGRVIGNGADCTGQVFGVLRVPTVKGQAIPAYDPRALKGIGVTYVTSPMGADHTAGNALETVRQVDPLGAEGQVEVSRRLQLRGAILDSLGVCLFVRPAFVKDPGLIARMLNARYGWELSYADVQEMGKSCLETEQKFNQAAGVSEEFCDVPEFMRYEPLPPRNTVFDLDMSEMRRIWSLPLLEDVF
jgi:aldehyde:ferredoxin oxidoreductase